MPELKFLSNEGDIDEGLGDAGIETFRDAPYASVARECGQNSSDARAKKPVMLSFDVIEIDSTEMPSLGSFKSTIESCLIKSKSLEKEKEIDFFECAKKSIEQDKLNILKISDENTRGLIGPCKQGTPFHSLLKGSGVSVKNDATSGGSFGIGKNAAFAVSDIQTVFYSTKYKDPKTDVIKDLYQGKSIFVSHVDKDGKNNLATGYWGDDGFQPVTNKDNVPEWMKRENIGTSLYCICFSNVENWQYRLAASLLQNFFCAIHRNEMNFSIDNGSIILNKDKLSDLFKLPKIKNAAKASGNIEDFEFSRCLYECLTAVETKEKIVNIPNVGSVSVKVLVKEGFYKKVCFIRNGMYIADNLEHFGEKFLRFPLYKDFVALVEPLDDIGITLFKKLENPKHDGFSAERLPNEHHREIAMKAMTKLGKSIREAIKEQSLVKPKDTVSIDELSEFFAAEIDPDKITDPNAIEDDPEKFKYKPKKRQKPKRPNIDNGGGSGTGDGNGGGKNGGGPGSGGGAGGTGKKDIGKPVLLSVNRNILLKENSKNRRLILAPELSSKVIVTVFAEGINSPEKIQIVRTNSGKIMSGSLILDLLKDVKKELEVEFDEEYDGPIEVFAKTVPIKVNKNEN